jgi:hypothetical protein
LRPKLFGKLPSQFVDDRCRVYDRVVIRELQIAFYIFKKQLRRPRPDASQLARYLPVSRRIADRRLEFFVLIPKPGEIVRVGRRLVRTESGSDRVNAAAIKPSI